MTNRDVANKFFEDRNGRFERGSMSVSYSDNIYYSYSTAIGKIVKDIHDNDVVLISDNNFSVTTSKHIMNLRGACYRNGLKTYTVPQFYEMNDFIRAHIYTELRDNLKLFKNSNLKRKCNREAFMHNYIMLTNLLDLADFKEYETGIKELLAKYKVTMEFVTNYKRGK